MESFEEFCEGWIGGRGGSKPYERQQLFSKERLKEQYEQITRAHECNKKRGAINPITVSEK